MIDTGWLTRVTTRRAVQKNLQRVFGHQTNTGVSPRHHSLRAMTQPTPPREEEGARAKGAQGEDHRPKAEGQLGVRRGQGSSGTKTVQKLHLLTDESTQLTSLLSRYGRRVLDDLKKAVPAPDAPGAQQTPRTPGDGGASSVPGLNLQFAPPPMGASPTTPGSCTSRASCPTARLLPAPSARFNLVGDADLQSLLTARDLTFRPNPNDRTKTTPLEAGHLRTPMAQRLTAKVRKEAVSKNTYCV